MAKIRYITKGTCSRAINLEVEDGKVISVEFDGADYFLIWTKPGAKYLCLEPWSGIPDYVDSDYDITKKTGIIKAAKGETIIKKHSFEIE